MTATFADISKARRTIGYSPVTDIEEGVQRYCEWFTRFHGQAIRALEPDPVSNRRRFAA